MLKHDHVNENLKSNAKNVHNRVFSFLKWLLIYIFIIENKSNVALKKNYQGEIINPKYGNVKLTVKQNLF